MRNAVLAILTLAACALAPALATGQEKEAAFRTKFPRELGDSPCALVATYVGGKKEGTVPNGGTVPIIDGEVDRDAVWSALPPASHTTKAWAQLGTKTLSARQTVVYACYDDDNLYLGFVSEEPELQNVQMDGNLGSGHLLGNDDFVEAALEIGGLRGEGQVFSFRANVRGNSSGWGGLAIPSAGGGALAARTWHIPVCRSAGKFGPNRWMTEIEIPFKTLKMLPERPGLATPSRGDVIGLKLARYGAAQQDPRSRMLSTWNSDIVYPYLHICGYNGLLYFEDSNTLVDGDFSLPAEKSPWKREGETLTQPAAVHASSYYLLRVDTGGKPSPEVTVDGRRLELKDGQAGLWTGDKGRAVVTLKGAPGAPVKKVSMEYQPGEEPPGLYCLTNNYRRSDRNIRAKLPDAPEGRYQYVRIDYAGKITTDDNPARAFTGTGAKFQSWAYDDNLHVVDVGGKEGWIPFSKGSLTALHKPVFWNPANPGDPACWGRHPIVMDVDLGQEYFVGGLDLLWPGPNIINVEIWGKAKEADDWTLLDMSAGPYVAPEHHRPRRGWDSVRGLDSVLRFVRFRVTPQTGDWSYPQMDGVQEFWVWGLPKDGHAGLTPFKPWVSGKVTPPVRPQTATLDEDAPLIVPRPKEMKVEDGWLVVTPDTKIVAQDSPEAKRVARQIHDEILRRWQVDLAVVGRDASDVGMRPVLPSKEGTVPDSGTVPTADAPNSIYLGVAKLGDKAKQVAAQQGLTVDVARPQSYGLRVTPSGAAVVGADELGLYYGVQSLMMAMRWRNAGETGSPVVRCMRVLDGPGSVLERGIYHRRSYPPFLTYPESDIERIKRLCQLLSRFKYNVIYLGPNWSNSMASGPRMSPWAKKLLPQLCREVREEYHVEIRPAILWEEGEGGDYWNDLSRDCPDLREHDPDEDPAELGQSANLCPLDERTYERHFARIDETLEDFGHPSKVWMFGQIYVDAKLGARWDVCRRCRKSGKTPEELYAYFINRIAQHLEEKQVKGIFRCPWLQYGGRDASDVGMRPVPSKEGTVPNSGTVPRDHRLIVIDPMKLPQSLEFDLWDREDPFYKRFHAGEDYIKAHFAPERTANGPLDWASGERYLQDAPQTETELLVTLSGASAAVWSQIVSANSLADVAEEMWFAPSRRPGGAESEGPAENPDAPWAGGARGKRASGLDYPALGDFVYSWWYGHDFPGWRAGTAPRFLPLNLRPFANHLSRPTGLETMEPGRPPEIDLRYLPTGLQTLANVPFDIIDPDQNGGKATLMMGRPAPGTLPKIAETICEQAGPIPVGRRLASLAFLRIRWHCRTEGMSFEETWLRPTCRVVYDDGSWLVVDSFLIWHAGLFTDEWNTTDDTRPYYRIGWRGNCPTGASVSLHVVEWVNPYPEKLVDRLELVTPDYTDLGGKRVSDMMEAFVAITGIESTQHDIALWAHRERPPLLSPVKARTGVELKSAGDLFRRGETGWGGTLRIPQGQVAYTVQPMAKSSAHRNFRDIYDLAYNENDFSPFGVEVTFEKPMVLQSVDIRGPTSLGAHWGAYAPREKKADVTVEVSSDGTAWRKAGELKGVSSDADFIPVDVPDGTGPVKSVRMTGTVWPYREAYHPVQVQGDQFWRGVPQYNPSFWWRFVVPADAAK